MVRKSGLVGLLLGVVVALLGMPGVATAQAERASSSRPAVDWGPTSWVSGAGGYAIGGRLAGPPCTVRLQYKVKGGWRTLDSTRSRKGAFSLAGPWDWYGAHQVRLLAAPAKGRPTKVLGKQTLTVLTDYAPRGQASEFVPFSSGKQIYRFNPCRPIRWRFNSGGGAGDPLLSQVVTAVDLVSRASGIPFEYIGTSTTVPWNVKKLERKTDLVVAFAHRADLPGFEGATARGGVVKFAPARKGASPRSIRTVQAGVTIDIETIFSGAYSFDQVSPSPTALLVFMHELGHAMGLDHVTTSGSDVEVMFSGSTYIAPYPDGQNYPRWGAGDLAGLSRVGAASSCL